MLTAVTRGTQAGQDLRQATIDHTRVAARLGAALREAQRVVAADSTQLILWQRDLNDDGDADLDELELIRWDSQAQAVVALRVDPSTVPTDLAVDLGVDPSGRVFGAVDEGLFDALTGGEPAAVQWAQGVTGFVIDTHVDPLSQAKLVSYRIQLGVGDFSETAIGTHWLRNHWE